MRSRLIRDGSAIGYFLVLLACAGGQPIVAGSIDDLAAAVGQRQTAEWRAVFTRQLLSEISSRHLVPAALDISLRAFKGQVVSGSAADVAGAVAEVCIQVDQELRRGRQPAEVALAARRSALYALRSEESQGMRESAHRQLRRQLSGMGREILEEVERRPGPQGRPGAGSGAASPSRIGSAAGTVSGSTSSPGGSPNR